MKTPPCNVVVLSELPIENNKHPNFEWREARGVDCFVLRSYPIWGQCVNSFVANCSYVHALSPVKRVLAHVLWEPGPINVTISRQNIDFVTSICLSHKPRAKTLVAQINKWQFSQINAVTDNHKAKYCRAWGEWLTSHKYHGWGGWVLAFWTWLFRD